ncbi:MAG: glycosyltransferase family 4 protein [Thermoanaerobaculia bacterium]|nr:glycosyltransferase family 4 protein [Thermoanaerobaculia bacterium]
MSSGEAIGRVGICTLGMDGGRSGIGRYTCSLIDELRDLRPAWQVDLIGQGQDRDLFGELPEMWRWVPVPSWVRGAVPEIAWMQLGLRRLARERSWDVAFMTAANRRLAYSLPCVSVGTVHDFSSLHVEGKYDRWRRFYILRVLPALVRRLDRVLSVSRASARDIEAFGGVPSSRIDVVPNGVNPRETSPPDEARRRIAARLGIEAPWLLYTSRLEHPGKNHVRLIAAFERLLADHPRLPHRLVLAGADWNGSEIVHGRIGESPVADRIWTPGFVEQEVLDDLVDGADMVAFPSLYEGFGLPVLESMAAGIPVACSNLSSLPEVGGEAVVYFDPYDESSIAQAVAQILVGSGRQDCIAAGLRRARDQTWRRTAVETISCLERAVSS